MKSLSMFRESAELESEFSNKNIKFKKIILENLEYSNKEELVDILQLNIESLKNSGKTTLSNIQEFDDKIKFIIEFDGMINSVLQKTDWFNTSPIELNIDNIKKWLSKCCDTALLNIFQEMLLEINK